MHNLGTTDYNIRAMIAFSSRPYDNNDAGANVAFASGDVFIIEEQNADSLQVRNSTCSEQYLYVELTTNLVDAGQ